MHNSIEHEVYHAHKCKTVDILTFISMVNATSQSMKARKNFSISVFITSSNFMLSWVEHEKCFLTSGPEKASVILYY